MDEMQTVDWGRAWPTRRITELGRKPWNPKLHPRGPGGRFFDGPDFEGDDEAPARSGGKGVFGAPLGNGPGSSVDDAVAKFRAEVGYDRVQQIVDDADVDWTRKNGDAEDRAGRFDTSFSRVVKAEQDRIGYGDTLGTDYLEKEVARAASEVWPGTENEVREALDDDDYWEHVISRLDGPEGRGIQDDPYLWGHILRSALGEQIRSKGKR